MADTKNNYLFETNDFRQSSYLQPLLNELEIRMITFHGLRDTHASFLFSKDISISRQLGHNSIFPIQNYYLELMPEKKSISKMLML